MKRSILLHKLIVKKLHKNRKISRRTRYRKVGGGQPEQPNTDGSNGSNNDTLSEEAIKTVLEADKKITDEENAKVEELLKKKEADDANQQLAVRALTAGENVIRAGTIAFAISAAIKTADVIIATTQVAASIGSSIPVIGVALVLVDKMIQQVKGYIELTDILSDIQVSLLACDNLIKLIIKTINTFQTYRNKYLETIVCQLTYNINNTPNIENKKKQMKELSKKVESFVKSKINPIIEVKLQAKIKIIDMILREIDAGFIKSKSKEATPASVESTPASTSAAPNTMYNRMKSSASSALSSGYQYTKNTASYVMTKSYRFFIPNDYMRRILNALNVINNLLIVYNSQFDWVVRANERFLKDITIPIQNENVSTPPPEAAAPSVQPPPSPSASTSPLPPPLSVPPVLLPSPPPSAQPVNNSTAVSTQNGCNKGNDTVELLLDVIWNEIESSTEFADYLIQEHTSAPASTPASTNNPLLNKGGKITRRIRKLNKKTIKIKRRTKYRK